MDRRTEARTARPGLIGYPSQIRKLSAFYPESPPRTPSGCRCVASRKPGGFCPEILAVWERDAAGRWRQGVVASVTVCEGAIGGSPVCAGGRLWRAPPQPAAPRMLEAGGI